MSRREQRANDGARISAKPQGGGVVHVECDKCDVYVATGERGVKATMDAHRDRHNSRGGRR